MKKVSLTASAVFFTMLAAALVTANNASDGEGFCITVSPNVLVLSSPDTIVTVHSNIPYGTVDTLSLTLNGIPSVSTKADALGCLVVKFDKADLKAILSPGAATLTLSGLLKDGTAFEASDTITVK